MWFYKEVKDGKVGWIGEEESKGSKRKDIRSVLVPGAVVCRQAEILFGVVEHWGMVVEGCQDNLEEVKVCDLWGPDKDNVVVSVRSFKEFMADYRWFRVREYQQEVLVRPEVAVERAMESVGEKGWDINNTCEHLVGRWIFKERRGEETQSGTLVMSSMLTAFGLLLARFIGMKLGQM